MELDEKRLHGKPEKEEYLLERGNYMPDWKNER